MHGDRHACECLSHEIAPGEGCAARRRDDHLQFRRGRSARGVERRADAALPALSAVHAPDTRNGDAGVRHLCVQPAGDAAHRRRPVRLCRTQAGDPGVAPSQCRFDGALRHCGRFYASRAGSRDERDIGRCGYCRARRDDTRHRSKARPLAQQRVHFPGPHGGNVRVGLAGDVRAGPDAPRL